MLGGRFALALALMLPLGACSAGTTGVATDAAPNHDPVGEPSPAPSSELPDSGALFDAAADAHTADAGQDVAPKTCTDLQASTTSVTLVDVLGPAPAPTGGTIASGTYDLVSAHHYSNTQEGPTSTRFRASVRITGSTGEQAFAENNGKAELSSGTFVTSGTNFVNTQTCPPPTTSQAKSIPYSATSTVIRIYDGFGDELVFTRRPGS